MSESVTTMNGPDGSAGTRRIQLDVTGMTCIFCVRRIEKALNKIDGVRAVVDLASKTATVDADAAVSVPELCDAVRRAGYEAQERPPGREIDVRTSPAPGGPLAQLWTLLTVLLRWISPR